MAGYDNIYGYVPTNGWFSSLLKTDIKARVIGYNIENDNLLTGFTPSPEEDNPYDLDDKWLRQ